MVLRLTATTVTRTTRRDRSPDVEEEGAGAAEEIRQGIDPGQPGASAWAEFERRRRRDATRRRRRFGRLLAPVVAALGGVAPSTARWAVGGEAEERVGLLLRAAVGEAGVVLHDRAVPHSRANFDHIAIVATGVWVVDTKRYHGRVRRGRPFVRLVGRRTLVVNGQDRGHLLVAARRQRAVVEAVAGPGTPVHAVLCFADASWDPLGRPFTVRGVTVTWPRALTRALAAPGPLGAAERDALALRLARAFPPYAPSGTSHRPTGASPRR